MYHRFKAWTQQIKLDDMGTPPPSTHQTPSIKPPLFQICPEFASDQSVFFPTRGKPRQKGIETTSVTSRDWTFLTRTCTRYSSLFTEHQPLTQILGDGKDGSEQSMQTCCIVLIPCRCFPCSFVGCAHKELNIIPQTATLVWEKRKRKSARDDYGKKLSSQLLPRLLRIKRACLPKELFISAQPQVIIVWQPPSLRHTLFSTTDVTHR